jgi:hypothetical protein
MSGRSTWVVAAAALVLASAACVPDPECPNERFVVQVAGTCASAPTTLGLITAYCRIDATPLDPSLRLPQHGEVDQNKDPLRQGGWQLYGKVCPASAPGCVAPSEFRRCFARRVQWHLELDCVDGSGAPVCRAELTE